VFDLASFAFRVKIVVCSISSDSPVLSETIFANKFRRQIRILQSSDGSYEALFPLGEIQEKLKHKKNYSDYQYDRFHMDESPDHDDDSEENQPRRRRSLSDSQYDNFLNDGGSLLKVLMFLDEKNENEDEQAENEAEPDQEETKESRLHIEKKLDYLFTQEVPMNNLYYEETQSAPQTSTKAHSETMGNFFSPEMGTPPLTQNSV
jgi:hypothetical protein